MSVQFSIDWLQKAGFVDLRANPGHTKDGEATRISRVINVILEKDMRTERK